MAFAHFHRHKSKYLIFAFIAMVFSLLSFNITRALTDMAANAFGHASARLTFTSSSGKQVQVEDETLASSQLELAGACDIFAQMGGLDPYVGMPDSERAFAHAILLTEAEELGIAAPAEQVAAVLDRFKHFVQQMAQQQQPDVILTVDDFARLLGRRRLTEERLKVRLGELIAVEAYVRAMKGAPVASPARLLQLATPRATRVGVEYVALDFAKFKEQLQAAPPADADLETWFKALATDVIEEKYTRGERLALEFVLVDVAAWDPASVAAELVPPVELTDEELLAEAKRDALRYFGDRSKVPAALADVTDEAKAKIKKDRQLKAVLEKLRADFDAAVAALPAVEPPAPLAPDADDAAKEAAKQAEKTRQEERVAAEAAEFAKVVARYGFAVKPVVDQEPTQLALLDPPKDPSLRFLVTGLSEPGAAGGRTHSVLPTGERTHAYVVRKSAATKPAEPKPFAEVKEQALAQWIEEHAKESALAKGAELLALLLAEAEKSLPAEVLAALQADRDGALKEIADDRTLDAEAKKANDDLQKRIYTGHVFGAAGPDAGARFGELAKQLGLEAKPLAAQRRDVASSWYYNDRFSGAERFLFRQNRFASDGSSEPMLLALAAGAILPQVLVDDPSGAAYVARVTSRQPPTAADLTARDRQQAERDLKSEWSRLDNPFLRMQGMGTVLPVCENPFAMAQICRRHHPMVRASENAPAASPGYGYGY